MWERLRNPALIPPIYNVTKSFTGYHTQVTQHFIYMSPMSDSNMYMAVSTPLAFRLEAQESCV